MEHNIFIQNIITQLRTEGSSRRRGELDVITKLCVFHILFLFFIIKISMKEESGFLITYSSLRPRTEGSMRFCVRKLWSKIYDGTGYQE